MTNGFVKILLSGNRIPNYFETTELFISKFDSSFSVQEIIIDVGGHFEYVVNKDELRGMLPVIGKVQVQNNAESFPVEAGQIRFDYLSTGDKLKYLNVLETEPICLLEMIVDDPVKINNTFLLELPNNKLVQLIPSAELVMYKFFIGKFAAREKATFVITGKVYAYVVEGAFELNERLLQRADGLLIESSQQFDFECLSLEGVLLVAVHTTNVP
jgi:proteasome assembly chaperone (PAC2) family protein